MIARTRDETGLKPGQMYSVILIEFRTIFTLSTMGGILLRKNGGISHLSLWQTMRKATRNNHTGANVKGHMKTDR